MIYALSVLAAIGTVFLLIRLFTWAYYRKKAFPVTILCDVRAMDREEVLELLEALSSLSHSPPGRCAFGKVVLRTRLGSDPDEEELALFLRLFDLRGEILYED